MQTKRAEEEETRLTILRKLRKGKRSYYECKCSCGTVKIIRSDNVNSGMVKSCGCLSREKASQRLRRLHNVPK